MCGRVGKNFQAFFIVHSFAFALSWHVCLSVQLRAEKNPFTMYKMIETPLHFLWVVNLWLIVKTLSYFHTLAIGNSCLWCRLSYCIFTWHGHVAVSSQGMQDHFGAKSATWLTGYTDCQPCFQFPEPRLGRTLQRGWDFFWKMAAANCWLGVRTVLARFIVLQEKWSHMFESGQSWSVWEQKFHGFFLIFKIKTKSDATSF